MSNWGTPKDYAWLYSVSLTEQYKTGLLWWLKWDTVPGLYESTLREIAALEGKSGNRKGRTNPAETREGAGGSGNPEQDAEGR